MARRHALSAVVLPILGFLLSACGESESEREDRQSKETIPVRLQSDGSIHLSDVDRAAVGLEVAPASEDELPDVSLRFGRVRARLEEEALVASPVAGRVTFSSEAHVGAVVDEGTIIAEVVPSLTGAERTSLRMQGEDVAGQIRATEAEVRLREAEATRQRELAKSDFTSQSKLQEAETAVATLQARLDALRRSRDVQCRGEDERVTIRAPLTGTLVALDGVSGMVASPGTVLARIVKTGPRWVDVQLPPDDAIAARYEVSVGSRWVPAQLVTAGTIVDDDGTRHDRLEVDAANVTGLLPGASVAVRMARAVARGIVLPESAVVPGVGADMVFVETTGGVFVPRRVHVVSRFDGRVRLASGVATGESVVVRGAAALRGEGLRAELSRQE